MLYYSEMLDNVYLLQVGAFESAADTSLVPTGYIDAIAMSSKDLPSKSLDLYIIVL